MGHDRQSRMPRHTSGLPLTADQRSVPSFFALGPTGDLPPLTCYLAGRADEVGCVRMRRYFEREAREPLGLGIGFLSQRVDGQRTAWRERLRLERASFLFSTLVHAIALSAIISRMGVVQFAPAENESVEVEIVTKQEFPSADSPHVADEAAVQPSASELGQQSSLMPGPAARRL